MWILTQQWLLGFYQHGDIEMVVHLSISHRFLGHGGHGGTLRGFRSSSNNRIHIFEVRHRALLNFYVKHGRWKPRFWIFSDGDQSLNFGSIPPYSSAALWDRLASHSCHFFAWDFVLVDPHLSLSLSVQHPLWSIFLIKVSCCFRFSLSLISPKVSRQGCRQPPRYYAVVCLPGLHILSRMRRDRALALEDSKVSP